MSSNNIPGWRQACYYGGMVLMAIGFIVFLSTFLLVAGNISGPGSLRPSGVGMSPFNSGAPNPMPRALTGMVLIIIGTALRTVGARGLAGSGIVLDPQKARRDIQPWSRMAGGVVKDALAEFKNDDEGNKKSAPGQPAVKIRCRSCRSLNNEEARYCQQCGTEL